jgi:hypothetical protein
MMSALCTVARRASTRAGVVWLFFRMRPHPAAPPAAVQEKPAATILVYRDGHQGEVQNYAILRQTLWVFAGETTRRVSLADLDLQATKRLNDERGVDFFSPDLP